MYNICNLGQIRTFLCTLSNAWHIWISYISLWLDLFISICVGTIEKLGPELMKLERGQRGFKEEERRKIKNSRNHTHMCGVHLGSESQGGTSHLVPHVLLVFGKFKKFWKILKVCNLIYMRGNSNLECSLCFQVWNLKTSNKV